MIIIEVQNQPIKKGSEQVKLFFSETGLTDDPTLAQTFAFENAADAIKAVAKATFPSEKGDYFTVDVVEVHPFHGELSRYNCLRWQSNQKNTDFSIN